MTSLGLSFFLVLCTADLVSSVGQRDQSNEPNFEFVMDPNLGSRESGATCGVYSLWLAAKILGNDVPIEPLLSGKYVTLPYRSSATDLQVAAEQCGVCVHSVSGMSLDELRSSSSPVLLQFRYGRDLGQLNHWVVFLGDQEGKALVCDLPRQPSEMEYADLLALWSGNALVVNNKQTTLSASFFASRLLVINHLWFLIVVVVGASCVPGVRHKLFAMDKGFSCAVAGGAIVAVALIWSVVSAFANPLSIQRNPTTIRLLACASSEATSVDYCDRALNDDDFIVDCRVPMDFANGHIDGAVNLSIDSTITEMRSFLSAVDANRPVIVYCQSEHCGWAAAMATRLRCAGNIHAKVLSGGYAKWEKANAQ